MRQMVHPRLKTPQGEPAWNSPADYSKFSMQIPNKGGLFCIIQSVVQNGISVDGNIQGMWINVETVSQTLIISGT